MWSVRRFGEASEPVGAPRRCASCALRAHTCTCTHAHARLRGAGSCHTIETITSSSMRPLWTGACGRRRRSSAVEVLGTWSSAAVREDGWSAGLRGAPGDGLGGRPVAAGLLRAAGSEAARARGRRGAQRPRRHRPWSPEMLSGSTLGQPCPLLEATSVAFAHIE